MVKFFKRLMEIKEEQLKMEQFRTQLLQAIFQEIKKLNDKII